jgi:hypothetical protein
VAGSRGLDIIARFRSVTTDFNTRQVEKELDDTDRAFDRSGKAAKEWSRKVDRATRDVERDLKDVKGEAKEAGREVGSEFGENIGEGLRNGDFAGVALETATSLAGQLRGAWLPIAAGLGIGAAVANYIVSDIQKRNADIKAAGASLFQAVRDGMLEQAESEEFLTTALGVDSFEDALRKIASLAADMKVPVAEVYDYIESGGRVAGPALTAQLEKQRDALAKAAGNTRGIGENASPVLTAFRTIDGYAGRVADSMADAKGLLTTIADITKDPNTFPEAKALFSTSNLDQMERVAAQVKGLPSEVRVKVSISPADQARIDALTRRDLRTP